MADISKEYVLAFSAKEHGEEGKNRSEEANHRQRCCDFGGQRDYDQSCYKDRLKDIEMTFKINVSGTGKRSVKGTIEIP
jgi:hypothetical protein